jgi:O-antigen/teichoic acid export membrane protein
MGVLFLGYFSGKEAAGYYKVAKSFVKLISRIMEPIYEAIYPELVKILTVNSLKDFKRLLKYSTKNLVKFTIPAAIVVLIFANPIISLIFGKQYLPAANTLRVIAVAALISQLTFWIGPSLLALGRPGLRTVMLITSNTSYVALLFLLVPKYSYIGAAFAFVGFAIIKSLISMICLKASIKKAKDKISKTQATLTQT